MCQQKVGPDSESARDKKEPQLKNQKRKFSILATVGSSCRACQGRKGDLEGAESLSVIMKDSIIQEIFTLLESKALSPIKGGESDITVDCQLLDAKTGSGKTLMRHVKGTFMGTNGILVSYDFDLGDIPKSIKSIAEKNGYKFKTVIRRKSAPIH